jgi:hypothetical protein
VYLTIRTNECTKLQITTSCPQRTIKTRVTKKGPQLKTKEKELKKAITEKMQDYEEFDEVKEEVDE